MRYIFGIITLLAGVLGLFFVTTDFAKNTRNHIKRPDNYLRHTIPATLNEMSSKDLPLGNTEELARASERILSVTEWLNREYTLSNGKTFQLYISYWAPNKTNVRNASTHTPDRCWVENGWINIENKKKHDYLLLPNIDAIMPAYYREYEFKVGFNTFHRNVLFWFVVDGERYEYGKDALISNPISYLKYVFTDALKGSGEIFFIRIDSSTPIEEISKDRDFQSLVKILGNMVLYTNQKTAI